MELGKEVSNSKPKNPLKEDRNIIQNIGISNTGLLNSHKILSNTKMQYNDVEKNIALHNKLRARKKARRSNEEAKTSGGKDGKTGSKGG